ncbi:MAG TPA: type II secretion system F family protein [Acidobacteriaceae bacterium]|jgi:tight adherence protein C|nr:type II secretion system F family protein [Acidobacteriaceae bacterium]
MPFALYVLLAMITFCLIALLLTPDLFRPSPEAQRILDLVKSTRVDRRTIRDKERMRDRLVGIATQLRVLLGLSEDPNLRARLVAAGFNSRNSVDIFFAARLLVPLVGVILGSLIPVSPLFWVLALGGAGYLGPDIWLKRKTSSRKNRIRRSLPDALDLMVICVDAGLGLDQALLRIGDELAVSHPDISSEFIQVNREQRAGRPRLEAWRHLADRSEVEEFTSFVNMLTQTDRFGTPIIRALSRFSEDIRLKRQQRAEEAAAKTKIKIIFPLVLCIFPCIFIVLLAPAILNIASGLGGLGQ